MDEFELEVTDLRGQGPPRPLWLAALEEAAPAAARPAGSDPRPVPPEDAGTQKGARRPSRWIAALAAIALSLLVGLAVILSASSSGLATFARLFPTPTPLPVGERTIFVEHYAPWGTLLLNGHDVTPFGAYLQPPTTPGRFVAWVGLFPGQYTLEYRAAPFPTVRCKVSVPAASGDTCHARRPRLGESVPGFAGARIPDLGAQLNRVPAAEYAALLAAVRQALSPASEATVLPGETYRAADGSVAVAHERLTATFLVQLNTDAGRALPPGADPCVAVCEANLLGDTGGQSWFVEAHAVLGWRYATADGRVLVPFAPAAPLGAPTGDDAALALDLRWSVGWQVNLETNPNLSPECPFVSQYMQALLGTSLVRWVPGLVPAQGCVMTQPVFRDDGRPAGEAWFLYQFGVVLAVNDMAQRLLPQLPRADAAQLAQAQQIISQAGAGA